MSDIEAYSQGWKDAALVLVEMLEPRAPDWREHAPPWALTSSPEAYHWQRGFVYGWNWLAERRGWPQLPYVFITPKN